MDHAHALPTLGGRTIRGALASGWGFGRHLLEMVVAMLVGMQALGIAVMLLGSPPGYDDLLGEYAYMGAAMTATMVAWMRLRGHPWRDCGEMAAAMLAPMFALVLPARLGWAGLGAGSLMLPAHGAMIGGMIALMAWRWDRYSRPHGSHGHGPASPAPSTGDTARASRSRGREVTEGGVPMIEA